MLKPECKGRGFIDGNTDFVPTEKTFADIFPDIQPQELYYIDNEAYWIGKLKRNKEETGGEADEGYDKRYHLNRNNSMLGKYHCGNL